MEDAKDVKTVGRAKQELAESAFVREQLRGGQQSQARRYARFVVGNDSLAALARYELITTLFGGIPGALGLALRKFFYRFLFKSIGRNVVFGKGVTIKCPDNMEIGDNVVIDDGAYLDARGAADGKMRLGDNVIVGRNSMIHSKIGPLHIGNDSIIGATSIVVAQGGVYIGDHVAIAGAVKISGGLFEMKPPGDETLPPYVRHTKGPIRVGDGCVLASGTIVVDGVTIGRRCLIGANSLVISDVPDHSTVSARPAMVMKPRG